MIKSVKVTGQLTYGNIRMFLELFLSPYISIQFVEDSFCTPLQGLSPQSIKPGIGIFSVYTCNNILYNLRHYLSLFITYESRNHCNWLCIILNNQSSVNNFYNTFTINIRILGKKDVINYICVSQPHVASGVDIKADILLLIQI
jgi:hypothetical protein